MATPALRAAALRMVVTMALLTACTGSEGGRSLPAGGVARGSHDAIDSILPMVEHVRRFRSGTVDPVRFAGGITSRDTLAALVLRSASQRDTAALWSLALNRAELGWLVFPDHRYHEPPYELDPALFWLRLAGANDVGVGQLVDRFGGQAVSFRALQCDADLLQPTSARIRIWSRCVVRFTVDGVTQSEPLFGSIVERDGRVKLMSFAR